MKKTLKLILVVSLTAIAGLSFIGCPFLQIAGWGELVSEDLPIEYEDDADNFLIRINMDTKKTVDANSVGTLVSKKSRNAIKDLESNIKTNKIAIKQDPEGINNLNRESFKLLNGNSRAGTNSYSINNPTYSKNMQNEFWTIKDTDYNFVKYNFTCKAVGTHCSVWYYENPSITQLNNKSTYFIKKGGKTIKEEKFYTSFYNDALFKTIASKFDEIYEKEEDILGGHTFTESNYSNLANPQENIKILVSDIFNDAEQNATIGTFGYFYQTDMLKASGIDPTKFEQSGKIYRSNNDQIIYIDSYWLQTWTDSVYSTIAHEYNHLLNYVNKTVKYGKQCETWFTEMLSMTTEDMVQSLLDISDEDSPKSRLSLVKYASYYGFMDWPDKPEEQLYTYANAYALGAYLVRNFGGENLLKEIATNEYVNGEAITKALQIYNTTGINDEKIDFDYACKYLYQILFDPIYPDTMEYSLNKRIDSFEPIDLDDDLYDVEISENDIRKYIFFKTNSSFDIGPRGFYISIIDEEFIKYDSNNYYITLNYYDQTPIEYLYY